ncbi:MAG: hypothetical protein E7Z87_00705 [Cyanobacteria bacterium SIG26]|nr:hypothetical protein [Cyanobacteria bacterium SIG26]
MLVSAISYLNHNTNIGVENASSKQQSAKSKMTENFGHDSDQKLVYDTPNFVKNIIQSVTSMISKDKAETNGSRCLSIVG